MTAIYINHTNISTFQLFIESDLNKCVFSLDLKTCTFAAYLTKLGKSFQRLGAYIEKALRP